jgi:excisionase family DNA binding protein
MDRLTLRPSEVAEALGVSRSTVYALLASGELPSVSVAGRFGFPRKGCASGLRSVGLGAHER